MVTARIRSPIGHSRSISQCTAAATQSRCEYDTTDGQERNRAKEVLELAPTHQEGRGVDDGWQYEEQHELWSQL